MNLLSPDAGWRGKTSAIEGLLKERLGDDMQIAFERVDRLRKTATGKTPIVVEG